ncbi:MAG: methylthioribose-phosphate isomerase, partial [Verrucomicrobiota bacterium]
MKVHGQHYRTIWPNETDNRVIQLIDQRFLPHQFVIEEVRTVEEMATAIREMHVRGAGLIGAAAGYGMYLATLGAAPGASFDDELAPAAEQLRATRPTAVNLAWAIERQLKSIGVAEGPDEKRRAAFDTARQIADEDAEHCRRIGEYGVELIRRISERKGGAPVNVLTHCNAGWLAFVDHGSATAPIYAAHDAGI